MKRRVALIEFSIYDQFPLTSGYLHTYAQADPVVASAFEFVYYIEEVERATYAATLSAIRGLNAQILCFSCYVWNMGLIKRLVADLRHDRKVERIILGGHQITHHLAQYVERTDAKTVVINGQGEIPFRATLQRLADSGDLVGLRGISFYADGQAWEGGESEMLTDLDAIPSPFLSGHFDRRTHPITIFETNRGCPYKCSFCTWGGDTLKVTKFSLDRIKEELRWIAKKRILFLYLADANWGMLSRDVEISADIAQLKREFGFPLMVYYAAAKNKPDGSMKCIEKFHEGGVITSQALGIQSLNTNTLELIDRKNIKNSAYIQMFERLKERKIDSYCELIWPLPGETLETLKAGFEQLVELGAPTTVVYPAILINNARLGLQVAEHGMETIVASDWKSELKLVKQTKYADRAAVDDGFWFYYAYFLLANCDRYKALLRFLGAQTGRRYSAIVADFAEQLRASATTSAYGRLIQSLFNEEAHGSLMTIGRLAAHLTHEERFAAQSEVARFVSTRVGGDVARNLAAVGLWIFSLPKVFADTVDDETRLIDRLDGLGRAQGQTFSSLARVRTHGATTIEFHVGDASDVWRDVVPFFVADASAVAPTRIVIAYPPVEAGYNLYDPHRNYVYAHGMIQRLGHIAARISVAAAGPAVSPFPSDSVAVVSAAKAREPLTMVQRATSA